MDETISDNESGYDEDDQYDDFDPTVLDEDEDVQEYDNQQDGELMKSDGESEDEEETIDSENLENSQIDSVISSDTRKIIVVPSEEKQSSNMMTLAEVSRAIAIRAKQISNNPYSYTDIGDLSDAISIARKELFDRRSPLVLERRMGYTSAGESIVEMWTVRHMAFPPLN